MPVTIKTGPLRFKDPSSGQYVGIDVIAERKTSEQIAEIENVGAGALEEIGSAKEEALEEIREIVEDVGAMTIHICTAQEYDAQTGIPTIANPDATTFYLVPGGDAPNLYVEWAYVNNAWEQFGSASIDLSGYVQKTDYASTSAYGVVKTKIGLGISTDSAGQIYSVKANSAEMKTGGHNFNSIVPAIQHESTFYGLAKAAGDTTQSQSDNAVGTYTDEAKTAIQNMLDVPSKSDIPEGAVQDVQVNGTSILSNSVANIPKGTGANLGVVRIDGNGLSMNAAGIVQIAAGQDNSYKGATSYTVPVVAAKQHMSAFYGLAKAAGDTTQSSSSNAIGVYTETAKSKISDMLNAPVSVSGTTPTINALPGIQYVCGEVATLDITLPASGCVDVVFQSGSTATVLTITPPTGVTLKWANGFDPDNLEANTTYEINVADGLGVAVGWT